MLARRGDVARRVAALTGLLSDVTRQGEIELLGSTALEGVRLRYSAKSMLNLPIQVDVVARPTTRGLLVLAGMGDGDELGSPRFNKANELRTRDTDNIGSPDATLVYDANGNLTDDDLNYKYEYDTLNRLRRVKNQSDAVVAEYWYNGLGYRIAMQTDVSGSGGVPDGSVTDAYDPKYYLIYDTSWRQVARVLSRWALSMAFTASHFRP